MSLVETYVFRTVRTAFLASLGVLTAVIWITQALRQFDLLTTKGQSMITFLMVTLLTIPSLVAVIAPVALFIAVIYALNKLNSDSELIVMSAAGVSPTRLLRPFVKLTVMVTILVAIMTLWAIPWSFRELRDLVMKIRADFITNVVHEGTFTTLDQGFIFHYRERGPDGSLRSLLMEDRRDPDHISSYLAEEAHTFEVDDNNYLVLSKGSVQRHEPQSKDAAIVVFDRYAIDLAQFGAEGDGAPLRPRERSTRDLILLDHSNPMIKQQEGRFRSELHDRFVSPLYALSFGLIAFVALGQARTTRQGRGTAILVAVVVVLLLRIAGFGASTYVVKSAAFVWLGYGIPLISLGLAAFSIVAPQFRLPRARIMAVSVARPA